MTKTERPGEAVVVARRIGTGARPGPATGDFTYTVLPDPPVEAAGERRGSQRLRTRLRSGKIVDAKGRFVTECLVYDLSGRGGRLRLPADAALPLQFQLFDEQTGHVHRCSVLWRESNDVGIRFEAQPSPAQARALADALRRKFYAVRN